MFFDYTIRYKSVNTYENPVFEAIWQFLVIPENNSLQEILSSNFSNSLKAVNQYSENGLGFQSIRVHQKKPFSEALFEAEVKLKKRETNPFNFTTPLSIPEEQEYLNSINFKIDFEPYLKSTELTYLPKEDRCLFVFNTDKYLFDNLLELNNWVYLHIYFKTGVTHVGTLLNEIIEKRHGVCQDFTHLFCAIARKNGVPARYVSGYLHQGEVFFGDSQMHAWAEVYLPEVGWIGFDPTNNILANHNHIKVCHGKDYNDCAPLKGIVFSKGSNQTRYTVEVTHAQQ